jgi:ATP-dependent Clp protease ATP-binding subunit ClpA
VAARSTRGDFEERLKKVLKLTRAEIVTIVQAIPIGNYGRT